MPSTTFHPLQAAVFRLAHAPRVQLLREGFALTPSTKVLDLGGRFPLWHAEADFLSRTVMVPAVTDESDSSHLPLDRPVELAFADKTFDLVFCDGLLESAANLDVVHALASEMRRVSRGVFVRVMAREFGWVAGRRFGPVAARRPSRPLTIPQDEMARLFPDCELVTERVLMLPRSYVALRRTEPVYRHQPIGAAAVTSSATPA